MKIPLGWRRFLEPDWPSLCVCVWEFEKYLNGSSDWHKSTLSHLVGGLRGLCRHPQERLHCPLSASGSPAGWRGGEGELVELVSHVESDYLVHLCHRAASGGGSGFQIEPLEPADESKQWSSSDGRSEGPHVGK